MKYYAIIDGEQRGPFELDNLAEAGVRPSTYVWCKGMSDWEKAEDVADICRMFRGRLHDLMHPGSFDAQRLKENEAASPAAPPEPTGFIDENGRTPTRFDRYLKDSAEPRLPSLEEVDSKDTSSTPPGVLLLPAILVTVFCFPPTGAVAIYHALKARKCKNSDDKEGTRDHIRSAKMFTGISLFLGLMMYAFLFRQL